MAQARPAEPPERPARFAVVDGRLTVTVAFPELVDAAVSRKLDGGLAATVVSRAYLFREGAPRAESLAVQTVRVAYDLWDEVFVVEQSGDGGRRVSREKSRAEALRRLTTLELPLGDAARLLPGGRYRVAVIVELNPVSPALLAQVRRWLSRPREGGVGDGESYFGSFVSLFVRREVGEAERLLRFRTTPFVAPEAPR